MDEQQKYQELYLRYNELLKKTLIKNYQVTDKEVRVEGISEKDLKERSMVQDKLAQGLIFLNDSQLLVLSEDPIFSLQASDVLKKRRAIE